MESKFLKCLIYIFSRYEFFALKYTGGSNLFVDFIVILLLQLGLNILSIAELLIYTNIIINREITYIVIFAMYILIYQTLIYFFDKKRIYRRMINKLKNDEYYKMLEIRRNTIDFLLVIHFLVSIVIFSIIIHSICS